MVSVDLVNKSETQPMSRVTAFTRPAGGSVGQRSKASRYSLATGIFSLRGIEVFLGLSIRKACNPLSLIFYWELSLDRVDEKLFDPYRGNSRPYRGNIHLSLQLSICSYSKIAKKNVIYTNPDAAAPRVGLTGGRKTHRRTEPAQGHGL